MTGVQTCALPIYLYIEGDNLEVLKLLQESYLNRVKMIYIDPPYNTGNDFIYTDNRIMDKEEYEDEIEYRDEEENINFRQNSVTNPRFHSDWCSMMYSRLKLARNLLQEDGVIFVSIDDQELYNLKKICDEILGEENFMATFIWEKRLTRENRRKVSFRHDYILSYVNSVWNDKDSIGLLPMNETATQRYKNPDNDIRGVWTSVPAIAQAGHGTKNQFYTLTTPSGKVLSPPSGSCWRYTKDKMDGAIADNRIWFGSDGNGVPRIKKFLNEGKQGLTPETLWTASEVGTNDSAKRDLVNLFHGLAVFETPKPINLIKHMQQICNMADQDIILDFFSGSATTAHAVMQLNAEDGGNRKYIMVQLQEPCKEESEAFKAGYKNICEIGKERIRRAGEKIKEEIETENEKNALTGEIKKVPDIGFRVLRVDDSNMKEVYYAASEYSQNMLEGLVSNIKEDRSDLDLLYGIMLDWGLQLSLSHKMIAMQGFTVHVVDEGSLVACFAEKISEKLVREIASMKPLRVVFRDSCFAGSPEKINLEEIFKTLSPETSVRVI